MLDLSEYMNVMLHTHAYIFIRNENLRKIKLNYKISLNLNFPMKYQVLTIFSNPTTTSKPFLSFQLHNLKRTRSEHIIHNIYSQLQWKKNHYLTILHLYEERFYSYTLHLKHRNLKCYYEHAILYDVLREFMLENLINHMKSTWCVCLFPFSNLKDMCSVQQRGTIMYFLGLLLLFSKVVQIVNVYEVYRYAPYKIKFCFFENDLYVYVKF